MGLSAITLIESTSVSNEILEEDGVTVRQNSLSTFDSTFQLLRHPPRPADIKIAGPTLQIVLCPRYTCLVVCVRVVASVIEFQRVLFQSAVVGHDSATEIGTRHISEPSVSARSARSRGCQGSDHQED
jgi:hypothetical protein